MKSINKKETCALCTTRFKFNKKCIRETAPCNKVTLVFCEFCSSFLKMKDEELLKKEKKEKTK